MSPEKRPALQLASPYEVLDVQALLQSTLRSGEDWALCNLLTFFSRAVPTYHRPQRSLVSDFSGFDKSVRTLSLLSLYSGLVLL